MSPCQPARRGVTLLMVMSLLALFTVVGVSFVYFAESQATSARYFRQAQSQDRPEVEPELLLAYFLGQLVHDAPDDETGVYSALRGHSLSRNMLGMDYVVETDGRVRRNARGELVDAAGNVLNSAPFSGTGRQHFDPKLPFRGIPDNNPAKNDASLVNYTYFPRDGFLRDPERAGWRTGLRAPGTPDNRRPFASGFNAPYTYPDLNNVYLAAVSADGKVMLPSYHRPWAGFGSLDPGNWRWTSDIDPTLKPGHALYKKPQPWLKYLVLRPRPADMGPGFPLPGDAGGDVQNLVGGPPGNDSVWLDLGFPVLTAPDGRKFKPLFAPLIVDLDGRVNLNVHGNLRGVSVARNASPASNASHASHQGWGPWEVNPEQLAPLPGLRDPRYAAAVARRFDVANLLSGTAAAPGRFGRARAPHSTLPGNVAPGPQGRFYAPADFDGSRELPAGNPSVAGRPTFPLRLPGSRPAPPYQCFPLAGVSRIASGYGNGSPAERADHPLLYNPLRPLGPDRAFALSDLEALLRLGDKGSPALTSDLVRLAPRFFHDPADPAGSARRRRMVTLASFDPDRPGVQGSGARDLLLSSGGLPLTPGPLPARRLDLNRYLPDYPNPDPQGGRITRLADFEVAQAARQHMAAEIFEVLWRVTGAGDPGQAFTFRGAQAARWDALRDLAQLAVNIVDYIDPDDFMTPFNWFTDLRTGWREWVYGTELPRVLLNEVYVEYANAPGDPGLALEEPYATRLKGNVWVELYNPMQDDPPLTAPHRAGAAQLEMPAAAGKQPYGIYRLVLAKLNGDLRRPNNVRGEIPPGGGVVLSVLSSFSPEPNTKPPPAVDTRLIVPADLRLAAGYTGIPGENKGFYLLGPHLGPTEKAPFPPAPGRPLETLRRSEMSYFVGANYPGLLLKPSVLLQRLACPHLEHQPNPLLPYHNPYVTVDYVRDVAPNYAALVGIDGPLDPPPEPPTERASAGRKQPYAAHLSQLRRQQPAPPHADQPQNTFFQHNADAATPGPNRGFPPGGYPPFDWLLHLDRQLISPMELLHVSAYQPHELTQQFRTGDTDREKFTHRAPWIDEEHLALALRDTPGLRRLYRALEFLGTACRIHGMMTASTKSPQGFAPAGPYLNQKVVPGAMAGTTASGGTWRIEPGCSLLIDRGRLSEEVVRVKAVGPTWFVADFLKHHGPDFTIAPLTVSERVPGKINLNTVWDEEVFLALCDPNLSSGFKEGAARTIFKRLRDSRTVSGQGPGPGDRPLRSLAAGDPDGGLQDTLLRFDNPSAPDRLPLLAAPGRAHPYETYELLTKIFNSTTVRSNVFAVWLTVGFFEVTDENARPVKLGREIGHAEGRHVRHRMFAIVDRSVLLANPGPLPTFDPRSPLAPALATGPVVPYFSVID